MALADIMPGYYLKNGEKMNKVIITGGTGFIGSHIISEFCNNGIEIGCLVRESSNLSNINGLNIQMKYGDLQDLQSLIESFKGYSFVIHNAAYVRDWGDYKIFYKTNIEGTLNVLTACIENGIKDIIMTGSNAVYGEEDTKEIKDETFDYNSHYKYFLDRIFSCKLNYYRDTKAIATRKAIKFGQDNNLNLTILEPIWVYGEREFNTGFYEYIKTAKSKVPFIPGSKRNKFHVIYAGDLARAYYLAFNKKLQGINRIVIGNKKADLMDYIYSLFCKEANVKKPRRLPKWMIYPFGFITELIYTILRSKKPPLLTRGRVNMFYDNIEYSVKKSEILLGFTNRYSLEEGITRTVQWYKENGFI